MLIYLEILVDTYSIYTAYIYLEIHVEWVRIL
jgi:hypothetical protein